MVVHVRRFHPVCLHRPRQRLTDYGFTMARGGISDHPNTSSTPVTRVVVAVGSNLLGEGEVQRTAVAHERLVRAEGLGGAWVVKLGVWMASVVRQGRR